MSVPVVYLPKAEDDIAAAHDGYEQRSAGLGDQFLEALHETIERVADNPQLYGILRGDIRAVSLGRFPYVVYYRDRGSDVLVIAVQHGRRSSRNWRGRA